MLRGLTEVPEEQLKILLKGVHRGTLEVPITAETLALHGLQDYGEPILDQLRGLDGRGLKAVIVCVIAERTIKRGP